jgi:hypothetical protein
MVLAHACVCGLKLLVYEALSCWCMRPQATGVAGVLRMVLAHALHNEGDLSQDADDVSTARLVLSEARLGIRPSATSV